MKTIKIAASLISLSLIVPGLIVAKSVQAQAQNQQLCPTGYFPYEIQEGDRLKYIAEKYTKNQEKWSEIYNPRTKAQFTEQGAKDLEAGDIVCIPNDWD